MPRTSTSATSEFAGFRRALSRWYRENGRHALPWRLTRDPYAILVSEVMLQQTQVDRVLPYYAAWLERWPTFGALAEASPAEVIRAWRGLGYNRRALNLHRLAVLVRDAHEGRFPEGEAALRALPGVGPYTASAILCFARDETVPVADTNIARVVARTLLGLATQRDAGAGELAAAMRDLLPSNNARGHNLALMDFGALVCTARMPACESCPVRGRCAWRAAGYPAAMASARPAPRFETTARFARGRIIDLLRDGPLGTEALASSLPDSHARRLADYLAALQRDGMVVPAGDGWSLPA
jgi:A/G-specific adenine glycosylase